MDNKLVSIGIAAKELGISVSTLRKYEKQGKITSTRTPGNQRRYDLQVLKNAMGFSPAPAQPNAIPFPQITPQLPASNAIPGDGQTTVPSVQQMIALLQAGKRFYFESDQAVRDSQINAQIMERNLNVWEPLQARMLSACQMPLTVIPNDQKDERKIEIAKQLQQIIEEIPNLFKYKWALMTAIWYGRAAVNNIYDWDYRTGYKRMVIRDWIPIHGDSLVYKWDSPAVGIRVGVASGNQSGATKELYVEPADFSRVHPLTPLEREAHVVHAHLLLAGNFLDPYSAGNVKGTGIRNAVYWTWFLKNQLLGMLTEFLERAGLPITVVTYQYGNPEAQQAAEQIAAAQSFSNIIAFPRFVGDYENKGQDSIYRIEPGLQGVQNIMTLVDYFDAEMRRYIVGQDATSKPVSTGLGSTIADVQENTFFRLVKMDCENLEQTLTQDLLWVLCKYTFPGETYKDYKIKINTSKPDKKEYMESVERFVKVGGTVIEHEAREVLGFTQPTDDDIVIGGKANDPKVLGEQVDVNDLGKTAEPEQPGTQPPEKKEFQHWISDAITETYGWTKEPVEVSDK